MRDLSWHSLLIVLAVLLALFPVAKIAGPIQTGLLPGKVNELPHSGSSNGGISSQFDQSNGCTPASNYPAADTVSGFNGLAIEYSIDGLPISEFTSWRRVVAGYPSGSQVTINFKLSGPYSIQGSWETMGVISLNGDEIESTRAPDQSGAPGWSYSPKPVVVTLTDEMKKSGFSVTAHVTYTRSTNSEDVFVTVQGLGCDQPSETGQGNLSSNTPSGPSGLIPEILIGMGGLTVIGGLIVGGVILILRNRTPKPAVPSPQEDPPQEDELIGYDLQISPSRVKVRQGHPASFSAAVYATYSLSGIQPAPQAEITLSLPPKAAGLLVIPSTGQGQIACTVSQEGPVEVPQTAVILRAATAGWQAEKRVVVEIEQSYELEFF